MARFSINLLRYYMLLVEPFPWVPETAVVNTFYLFWECNIWSKAKDAFSVPRVCNSVCNVRPISFLKVVTKKNIKDKLRYAKPGDRSQLTTFRRTVCT